MNRNQCPAFRGQCPAFRGQCSASVQTENKAEKPVEKPAEAPVAKPAEVKPIEKKEEVQPIAKKEEIKVAEKIAEQPKPVAVEAPKPAKQETQEEPKTSHPFEVKLKQLDEMGFTDRSKNIALLVKNQMDLVKTIRDLLEL
jgi:outer membrane biosynthesis protein TonB